MKMEWWIENRIREIVRLSKALIAKGSSTFLDPIKLNERRIFTAGPVSVIQDGDNFIEVRYTGSSIDMIVWNDNTSSPVSYYNPQEDQYYDDVLMHLRQALPLDALSNL